MKYANETEVIPSAEIAVLAQEHHAEQGYEYPLAFDPRRYEALAKHGILRVFTLRSDEGALAGYAVFVLMRHPHLAVDQATQDTVYVSPKYRGYVAGKFMRYCDEDLAPREVVRTLPFHVKLDLTPAGYIPVGVLWRKPQSGMRADPEQVAIRLGQIQP